MENVLRPYVAGLPTTTLTATQELVSSNLAPIFSFYTKKQLDAVVLYKSADYIPPVDAHGLLQQCIDFILDNPDAIEGAASAVSTHRWTTDVIDVFSDDDDIELLGAANFVESSLTSNNSTALPFRSVGQSTPTYYGDDLPVISPPRKRTTENTDLDIVISDSPDLDVTQPVKSDSGLYASISSNDSLPAIDVLKAKIEDKTVVRSHTDELPSLISPKPRNKESAQCLSVKQADKFPGKSDSHLSSKNIEITQSANLSLKDVLSIASSSPKKVETIPNVKLFSNSNAGVHTSKPDLTTDSVSVVTSLGHHGHNKQEIASNTTSFPKGVGAQLSCTAADSSTSMNKEMGSSTHAAMFPKGAVSLLNSRPTNSQNPGSMTSYTTPLQTPATAYPALYNYTDVLPKIDLHVSSGISTQQNIPLTGSSTAVKTFKQYVDEQVRLDPGLSNKLGSVGVSSACQKPTAIGNLSNVQSTSSSVQKETGASATSSPVISVPSTAAGDDKKNSMWIEHKRPDRRIYYYNNHTKQSSWEKPDDLKSETERLLSHCPWKEFKSANGAVYYHNFQTKESKWTKPKELEELESVNPYNIAADGPRPPETSAVHTSDQPVTRPAVPQSQGFPSQSSESVPNVQPQPPTVHPPTTPSAPPPKTAEQQLEEWKHEVLQLFPRVDLQFLDGRLRAHYGHYAVNNVCGELLESPDYPKSQAESVQEKQSPKVDTVDYYKDYAKIELSGSEKEESLRLLQGEFRRVSAKDIREVWSSFKGHYAPSYKALETAMKEAYAKKDSAKISYAVKEITISFVHDGREKKFVARLLKSGRSQKPGTAYSGHLQQEVEFVKRRVIEQKEKEDYEIAWKLNEAQYEEDGQTIECGCCYCEYPFENMVQCTDGHLFCNQCLLSYAKEAVFGSGKLSLTCMTTGCGATYPYSEMTRALPREILCQYEDRVREENLNLADLTNLVRCPHCNYAAIMDVEADKVFRCQNKACMKETCRLCKEDWAEHIGLPCEKVEKKDETKLRKEYEEKMTEAKVRTCHRCKSKFMKEEGCNKMTCTCRATMCYICRAPNIDYNHFCRHPRDPGKLCTHCKACSLWTNPDEDDKRAIEEIQKEGQEKRKEKGYTDDKVIGAPCTEPAAKKQRKK